MEMGKSLEIISCSEHLMESGWLKEKKLLKAVQRGFLS